MQGIVKEPKYKFEPKEVSSIKDKNGDFLTIGNRIRDEKGQEWKLDNIRGVSVLAYPATGKIKKTIALKKVDFTKYEKVA